MRKSHHSLHGLLRQSLLRSRGLHDPSGVRAGRSAGCADTALWRGYCIDDPCLRGRTVLVQDLPDEVWNVVPAAFPSRMDGSGC